MSVKPEYEDKTPDTVFIKVYPKKLRKLIRDGQLTRAEIGELLIVALRIDENNTCFPAQSLLANDVGMKSRVQANRLHQSLARKGALSWEADVKHGSCIYCVPDAFKFGSDYYQKHNSIQGGVSNSIQGGVSNSIQGGVSNSIHEVESDQIRISEQESSEEKSPKIFEKTSCEIIHELATPFEVSQKLISAGIYEKEAKLISQQYSPKEISKSLAQVEKQPVIRNYGAYLRTALEINTGRAIQYPNGKRLTNQDRNEKQAFLLREIFHPDDKDSNPNLKPIKDMLNHVINGEGGKSRTEAHNRLANIASGKDELPQELFEQLRSLYPYSMYIKQIGL